MPQNDTIEYLIAKLVQSGEQYLEPLESVFHVYLERCSELCTDAQLSLLPQVISVNVAAAQRQLGAGAAEEANASLDRALNAAGAFFALEAARIHHSTPLNTSTSSQCRFCHLPAY